MHPLHVLASCALQPLHLWTTARLYCSTSVLIIFASSCSWFNRGTHVAQSQQLLVFPCVPGPLRRYVRTPTARTQRVRPSSRRRRPRRDRRCRRRDATTTNCEHEKRRRIDLPVRIVHLHVRNMGTAEISHLSHVRRTGRFLGELVTRSSHVVPCMYRYCCTVLYMHKLYMHSAGRPYR